MKDFSYQVLLLKFEYADMKKIIYNILLVVFISIKGISQNTDCIGAGVYLTYEDFMSNKLSHTIDFNRLGHQFKTVPKIKIITPDSTKFWLRNKEVFKGGSIYGYYEYGKKYRYFSYSGFWSFMGGFYLEIVKEMNGKILYRSYHSTRHGGSHYDYYYSNDYKSEIKSLRRSKLFKDINYKE